jgi:hypothetical protein
VASFLGSRRIRDLAVLCPRTVNLSGCTVLIISPARRYLRLQANVAEGTPPRGRHRFLWKLALTGFGLPAISLAANGQRAGRQRSSGWLTSGPDYAIIDSEIAENPYPFPLSSGIPIAGRQIKEECCLELLGFTSVVTMAVPRFLLWAGLFVVAVSRIHGRRLFHWTRIWS